MEQSMDLSALGERQIDPETFRRVWARVMPDQKNSPIVVEPAAAAQTQSRVAKPVKQAQTASPSPRPSAAPAPQTVPPPARSAPAADQSREEEGRSEEDQLCRLMELAQEGFAACQTLARRTGNQARALSGLAADHRRALRQLSAAYFLTTGRRYQPKGTAPALNSVLIMALREQFLWEQRWARTCLQTAEEMADRDLQDLCRELAQDAALHSRAIRGVLERL